MYEKFTDRTREVMDSARYEAKRLNHEYVGTAHILLALIKVGPGVAVEAIKHLGFDLYKIRDAVERAVQIEPDEPHEGKQEMTPRTKCVVECAMEEARSLGHDYVGTEHILLGILRQDENVAARVLMNVGLRLEEVRAKVANLLNTKSEH